MYGLTRGATTLIGVLVAGFLLWLGTQILPDSGDAASGEYWAALGLAAAAGLTMALSQLLGGWTKWGWPRVSAKVFLLGFLPALILGGWILAAGDPGNSWLGRNVASWSEDMGIDGVVGDLGAMIPAIALGIGLVFGFTFDTTGPRVRKQTPIATPEPAVTKEHVVATDHEHTTAPNDAVGDDRRVHIGNGNAEPAPAPEREPTPTTEERTKS